MGGGSKTLSAALVALLLVMGLAACGGDDDSSSTAGEATSQTQPSIGAGQGGSPKGEQKDSEGEAETADSAGSSGDDSQSNFKPKQHQDSGGGSEQFQAKGGDNSVQEFGEESTTSELDEAAAAVHNFFDARAARAWEAACSYLASNVTRSLEEPVPGDARQTTSCAVGLEKMTNPSAKGLILEEAQQIDVGSLRIEGDLAFVIYRGPENIPFALPMALEEGSWKVAALAGGPLA